MRIPVLRRGFLATIVLTTSLAGAQLDAPRPLPDNPRPKYPDAARLDAVKGSVEIAATVNPDGHVHSVRVVAGIPRGFGLEDAAKAAVSRWRFEMPPGTRSRREYTTRIVFDPGTLLPITQWEPVTGAAVSIRRSDNVIQLRSGWIHTHHWFSDFVLELDFRLLEPETIAGVLLHALPGKPGDRAAYRVNLASADNEQVPLGRIDGGGLRLREITYDRRATTAVAKPTGEWQALRIESNNGTAHVTLNGTQLSAADEFVRRTGYLGVEVTRGAIEIKAPRVERRDTFMTRAMGKSASDNARVSDGSPGVISPRLIAEANLDYAPAAMQARTQGYVKLEAVVLPDGSVGDIVVLKSLDVDLDQSAVAAVRQWRFDPGRREGIPVPVLILAELSFTLEK